MKIIFFTRTFVSFGLLRDGYIMDRREFKVFDVTRVSTIKCKIKSVNLGYFASKELTYVSLNFNFNFNALIYDPSLSWPNCTHQCVLEPVEQARA